VSTPTTTHELTGFATPPASRAPAPSRRGNREAIWFLSAVAAVSAAICLFGKGSLGSPLRAGQTALLFATCGSAGVLALQVRRPDTWRGTRIMAGALIASATFQAIVWATRVGLGSYGRGDVLAGAIGTLLAELPLPVESIFLPEGPGLYILMTRHFVRPRSRGRWEGEDEKKDGSDDLSQRKPGAKFRPLEENKR